MISKSILRQFKFPFKQEAGDFSRTTPIFSPNRLHEPHRKNVKSLIEFFLHKQVLVQISESFAVFGKLVGYQPSNGNLGHRPSVLILENLQGEKVLVRGSFVFIATTEKEAFTNVKRSEIK